MTTFGAVVVVTVSVNAFVEIRPALSVTLMVKLNVPCAVGVPLMTPPLLRLSPAGSVPESRLQA